MMIRKSHFKEILIALVISAFLISTLPLKGTSAGIDDGNPREVGIEWVNSYGGCAGNLGNCDDDSVGFYNRLRSAGWTGNFNWGDSNAWEEDFKKTPIGGTDTIYIDTVDFAYSCGHGWDYGTVYNSSSGTRDDCYLEFATWKGREPQWGDLDLDWIVLDHCLTLAYNNGEVFSKMHPSWSDNSQNVMSGVHMILGFDTISYDTGVRGPYFAQLLVGDYFWLFWRQLKIREAWYYATVWSEPSTTRGAYLGQGNTSEDFLPGIGGQGPDPAVNEFLYYSRWTN